MSWARDEVLFRAQFGLLGLRSVYNLVYRQDRSSESVEQETVELVSSLVDDGLAVVGDRTDHGFEPWTDSVRVDSGREAWLQLTDAGRLAARAVAVDTEKPDITVRQWNWPLAQAAANVLVYGTIDWVELGQIHWRVKEVSTDVPVEVVQQRTLELIAELVRGGLVLVGSFDNAARGFVPWDCPLDEALRRIRAVYVDGFDDTATWEWFCLLELTRRGDVLAREIEAQTAS